MNRRSFFGRTLGALTAAVVAPFIPDLPAARPLGLMFHPAAFALVATGPVTRYDVLYGYGALGNSDFAVRILDEDRPRGSFLEYLRRESER